MAKTNEGLTQDLDTIKGGNSKFKASGQVIGTIPTTDASGNDGDFFFDVSTLYFKSGEQWLRILDVSTLV